MRPVISSTNDFILQPGLLGKHRETLDWISAAALWKDELRFFQKLLDRYAGNFRNKKDKQRITHLQNIITYYNGELVDFMRTQLRTHEKSLALALEKKDETMTEYFTRHEDLMAKVRSMDRQLREYKAEFFGLIEKAL